jgi:hypothetical protein
MILSGKLKVLRRGLKAWSQEISKLYKLINNSSYVLALLDGLEEQRTLPLIERNFRQLLKSHLLNLLEAKRVYWKQRATIRWVKFEDENTKLFTLLPHRNLEEIALPHCRPWMDLLLLILSIRQPFFGIVLKIVWVNLNFRVCYVNWIA